MKYVFHYMKENYCTKNFRIVIVEKTEIVITRKGAECMHENFLFLLMIPSCFLLLSLIWQFLELKLFFCLEKFAHGFQKLFSVVRFQFMLFLCFVQPSSSLSQWFRELGYSRDRDCRDRDRDRKSRRSGSSNSSSCNVIVQDRKETRRSSPEIVMKDRENEETWKVWRWLMKRIVMKLWTYFVNWVKTVFWQWVQNFETSSKLAKCSNAWNSIIYSDSTFEEKLRLFKMLKKLHIWRKCWFQILFVEFSYCHICRVFLYVCLNSKVKKDCFYPKSKICWVECFYFF